MRLKEARERADLTVLEVAHKLEISPQAVYKWERGMSYPTTDKLTALAKLYACTTDELLECIRIST